ncbi:hypothetical protein [Anaeromyxobacter terrae]|uniref:hypothetical protein n=1 Tax=Anaeromyxobacter terrae TaxID=2925406 RepID=UPI001F56CA4F|nr:hypothetical protein [Anaeromyxobacter sp. SG22]
MRELATHLQAPGTDALPVDPASLYPEPDGFLGRRAKAQRAKLVAGIEGVLRTALAPGETIRYVARGCRFFLFEYALGGAPAHVHNLTALVLTDRRLLLVQLDWRGRAGDIKNQVPLTAIRGAGRSLSGWRIRLADGSSLKFVSIRAADRKRLEALLPTADGPKAAGPSLQHLCPACLGVTPGPVGATATCPSPTCRIPFRDPEKAARLSTWVPGLGDLYLRHHLFGALEFLGSMAMLGLGLALLADALANPEAERLGVAAAVLVLLIVVPRAIDRRLTRHMGRKGLVPLALAPAPGAQARNLPSFPRWSPLLFAAGIAIAGGLLALTAGDLRHDGAVREASRLAAQGRFDDALARWNALEAAGGVDEARRMQFVLALMDAGDLADADQLRGELDGTPVDAGLVARLEAAVAREQAAITDYNEGIGALVKGDEATAWPRLDRAFEYLRGVKRPHLAVNRAELHAHLATQLLAEPLADGDVAAAPRWLDGAAGAPAAELAIVKAAYHSARGEADAARAALASADVQGLSLDFQLLALEARARLATSDAARAEVRAAAKALPRDQLSEEEAPRLDALLGEAE